MSMLKQQLNSYTINNNHTKEKLLAPTQSQKKLQHSVDLFKYT